MIEIVEYCLQQCVSIVLHSWTYVPCSLPNKHVRTCAAAAVLSEKFQASRRDKAVATCSFVVAMSGESEKRA